MVSQINRSIKSSSLPTKSHEQRLYSKQWYQASTYYQILYVEPAQEYNKREAQNLTTTILVKERGSDSEQEKINDVHSDNFAGFELDQKTIDKLKDYPREGDKEKLSSYLPSPGVMFPEGFMEALRNEKSQQIEQTELGNFYQPIRSLLYSRKISQLIAKTWWCYLEAKDNGSWQQFIAGNWESIDSNILDGLIAREIFLFAGGNPPDNPDPDNPHIYHRAKLREETEDKTRFLILPTSKSWQGISLALLLAGQAYYKIGDKYHQISQPILSTGEIVSKYCLEVDWARFSGDIKELLVSQKKPWVAYNVVLPYPPIPADVDRNHLKNWAEAEDEHGDFPFYQKDAERYLMDVDYFRSPYSYVPLSCS